MSYDCLSHLFWRIFYDKKHLYNLPEEKRQRITDAIFNEFAGSSGERVSINNIIKNANISRGSFYQYFDDKVDLVEVMTRSFINFSLKKATEVISRTHGDIFVTYDLLFEILCECSKDAKQSIIMKNLIKNIKANDSLVSEYFINRFKGVAELVSVTNNFDRSNLKYTSDEDVKCLSQILTQVLKNAVFNVFVIGKPFDEVHREYHRKLEIIKTGAIAN